MAPYRAGSCVGWRHCAGTLGWRSRRKSTLADPSKAKQPKQNQATFVWVFLLEGGKWLCCVTYQQAYLLQSLGCDKFGGLWIILPCSGCVPLVQLLSLASETWQSLNIFACQQCLCKEAVLCLGKRRHQKLGSSCSQGWVSPDAGHLRCFVSWDSKFTEILLLAFLEIIFQLKVWFSHEWWCRHSTF